MQWEGAGQPAAAWSTGSPYVNPAVQSPGSGPRFHSSALWPCVICLTSVHNSFSQSQKKIDGINVWKKKKQGHLRVGCTNSRQNKFCQELSFPKVVLLWWVFLSQEIADGRKCLEIVSIFTTLTAVVTASWCRHKSIWEGQRETEEGEWERDRHGRGNSSLLTRYQQLKEVSSGRPRALPYGK